MSLAIEDSTAPALSVRHVCKRFGDLQALDGVSFVLKPQEWIGLLGPNGAGKTTLMSSIAGLLQPDEGEFELFGQRVSPWASSRARALLGIVPQEIALYSVLSARENLEVFGRLNGLAGPDLHHRVRWTDLANRADEQIAAFSGGMKRRLNIACAVLHEPRVVLLDEPTVGVDPQGRRRIWDMLEELRHNGASLIHSSHQLQEIESTCDRVMILDRGSLVASGRVDELADTLAAGLRTVTILFNRAPESLDLGERFTFQGRIGEGSVRDAGRELPELLGRISSAGLEVVSLEVSTPDLEAVFSGLTGAELRE
jgi:ABC-2 type transport system ATP-binding protein